MAQLLPPAWPPGPAWQSLGRQTVILGLLVLVFYVVPLTGSEESVVLRLAGLVAVLAVLAVVLARQVRAGAGRVGFLISLLTVAVVLFATAIYALAVEIPGEFVGLVTRTDALYFTISTMSTTGYGDIHPAGQLARLFVILMTLFDLLVVGALASAIAHRFRSITGARFASATGNGQRHTGARPPGKPRSRQH